MHHAITTTLALLTLLSTACAKQSARVNDRDDGYVYKRRAMVVQQLVRRGVRDAKVLEAMRTVKRHLFVPVDRRAQAYDDRPLLIGSGQTISQPYIVAYMTEALQLKPRSRVLEIGTGSGYQAAVLAEIAAEVYSIEIIGSLSRSAKRLLKQLGYKNIHLRVGDGYAGWKEKAPFDAIILTAAPPKIPQPLIDQLKIGGVLIAPEGRFMQYLVRLIRTPSGIKRDRLIGVRFVPMTGKAQK